MSSAESTRRDEHARNVNEPTTSSGKHERRASLQAGRFLKNKHPELFEITPLAGGYRPRSNSRRDEIASRSKSSEAKIPAPASGSRARDRASIGELLETNVRCPRAKNVSRDDRQNSTVRMCSIAVSTVMMLAQRTYDDITMEHVRHTQEYFQGLKQPDGYPANVRQLSRLLAQLKERGKIVSPFEERENGEDGPSQEPEHEAPINTSDT